MQPLPNTLRDALDRVATRPGRGFRFIANDKTERYYSFAELRDEATRRAAFLQASGLVKGDRVALVIPEGHEFVLSFLGCVVAGLVPVPIFPQATFKAKQAYVEILQHITSAARAKLVLTSEAMLPFFAEGFDGLEARPVETCFTGPKPSFTGPAIAPSDPCFLQFTSGSTARPKGVIVTQANVVANSRAFLGPAGLNRKDDDVGVSWLPLFHDMGLIGFILGTIVCDIPVVILPTPLFARSPGIWLETIQRFRGTITYAPNFAYALVAKRLKERDIAKLDLSCLRVVGCGAEPIRARTLIEFGEKLGPAGLKADSVFLPSYGMAESTLAVTFHQLGTPIRVDTVDPEALKRGEALPSKSDEGIQLVSCGVPFPGHELGVIDEQGQMLPERRVGQIVTKGPSVSPGYFENPEATTAAFGPGGLRTGDLGYIADGNLYVCGRLKDLIIIQGANHYPQDLEWAAGDLDGVRRGNVVAFSVMDDGIERLVMVAEAASTDAARVKHAIAQRINEHFGLNAWRVEIVPQGTLPKTSSGKPQRAKTKQLFESGELAALVKALPPAEGDDA